jgi:hypothetical protein
MLRMRGRRMAMEAAMMPLPGSAVAQMVALMASPVAQSARILDNARWCAYWLDPFR